jgi:hypothetical protein
MYSAYLIYHPAIPFLRNGIEPVRKQNEILFRNKLRCIARLSLLNADPECQSKPVIKTILFIIMFYWP